MRPEMERAMRQATELAERAKSKNADSSSPSTADVSGSTYVSPRSEPVVSVDVEVDVGTSRPQSEGPKSGSRYFDDLQKDAENFGCTPLPMRLPDDLTPPQRAVAEDYAIVAGVYVLHDGIDAVDAKGVPYSKRWRMEVLGLSDTTIHRSLRDLEALGVLEDRGETEPMPGYPRGIKLYAPGVRFVER